MGVPSPGCPGRGRSLLPHPLGAGGHNLPPIPSVLLGLWGLVSCPRATGSPGPCAFPRVWLCPVSVFWGHQGLPRVLLVLPCNVTDEAPGAEGISSGAATVP